jgi:sn-glycerol 3-phosphate transport system substrate-binding protein
MKGLKAGLILLLALALVPLGWAQVVIDYWHSQNTTEATLNSLVDDFNRSQPHYRVVPHYAGNYREAAIRLVAALGGGNPPVLFEPALTVFLRLVEEGSVLELSDLAETLPGEMVEDFFPPLWKYGEFAGERYGLPWSMSVPVLFYNASIFRQLGVEPPRTWQDFEAAAAKLTTRNTTGFIDASLALIFEMMVSTRGGSILTPDERPNFTSPEAIEALEMLKRLAERGHSIPRGFGELDQALIDFIRTKAMMAFATFSYLNQAERFSVPFELGVAPVPTNGSRAVPLTDTQLVVLRGASEEQRQGAFAFWKFLMEPENIRRWVEISYYLPLRRAALPLLAPWFEEDPQRRVALEALEHAIFRPRIGAYALWQEYLVEAIERAVRGGMDPAAALGEAERRALETR